MICRSLSWFAVGGVVALTTLATAGDAEARRLRGVSGGGSAIATPTVTTRPTAVAPRSGRSFFFITPANAAPAPYEAPTPLAPAPASDAPAPRETAASAPASPVYGFREVPAGPGFRTVESHSGGFTVLRSQTPL